MQAIPLSKITTQPIRRLSTGFEGLDWIFGSSKQADGTWAWGLPCGGISLWAGAAGSGKSRLSILVASGITRSQQRVLYCQNEVSPQQFKSWVNGQHPVAANFYLGEGERTEEIVQAAQHIRPSLIVVDSVSMIENIERPAVAKRAIMQLRRLAENLSSHILMIGHLNARGKIKGGSTIPYLVDTVCHIGKCPVLNWLWIEIPEKHRFGATGRSAAFFHEAEGLEFMCVSDDTVGMHRVSLDGRTGDEQRVEPRQPRLKLRGIMRLLAS